MTSAGRSPITLMHVSSTRWRAKTCRESLATFSHDSSRILTRTVLIKQPVISGKCLQKTNNSNAFSYSAVRGGERGLGGGEHHLPGPVYQPEVARGQGGQGHL